MKCTICGKVGIRKKLDDFKIYGVSLGRYETYFCPSCREEWHDEGTSRKIEKRAKELGVWGLESKTSVAEVGNSLAVRISKRVSDFLKLKKGEEVFVKPESRKRIVVELMG